nr:regulatory iron-sulfur-containing complex subunit RicT [Sphingobacterium sp. E70]
MDFRELIKKMAEAFRIRIEMRQIGMRQEASRLGGIGSCGRELCCSTWLTDFKTVSTSAARYQNLSLNTLKLAGQCGKLKCCLNYELDSYMDALKDIPNNIDRIETLKGVAYLKKPISSKK